MTEEQFVARYTPYAERAAYQIESLTGGSQLEASLSDMILAQWALETGWGSSQAAEAANNLAGITGAHGQLAQYPSLDAFVTAYAYLMVVDCPALREHAEIVSAVELFRDSDWNPAADYGARVQAVLADNILPLVAPTTENTPAEPAEPAIVSAPAVTEPDVVTSTEPVLVDPKRPRGEVILSVEADPVALADSYAWMIRAGGAVYAGGKTLADRISAPIQIDSGDFEVTIPATLAQSAGVTSTETIGISGATGSGQVGEGVCNLVLYDDAGAPAVILRDVACTIDPALDVVLFGARLPITRGVGLVLDPGYGLITLYSAPAKG